MTTARTLALLWGALVALQAPDALAQGAAPGARAPKPAPAAPAVAGKGEAKKHFASGQDKYKKGDYAGALADFQAANDIKATPQAERYIGLCEDNLGHLQSAVGWYKKFLAHVPDKMVAQGDEIKKRVAEITALPGKVHVESNPAGAAVSVDGKPQPNPTPTDVELPPGAHTLKLAAEGRKPKEQPIDVAFASTQTVTADLEAAAAAPLAPPGPVAAAAPPPPAPPPPPREARSMMPAYVTGGLAVAAAGVGTVFGIIALGDKSTFDKNPTTQKADDGDTHALIADMAFGVALTFGVTSAVLFLTKDEAPAAAASNKPMTIKPTPTGFVVRF